MLKEADMTKDAPIEIVPGAEPEEAIDAVVTKKKQSISDGFDDTDGVRCRTFDDGDLGERAEVWFWLCALLRDVMYCSEGYFVDLVNFFLSCIGFATGRD
jgi:hypothetical protein